MFRSLLTALLIVLFVVTGSIPAPYDADGDGLIDSEALETHNLISLGRTFHFRSDSDVCDTAASGHSAALTTLSGMGIDTDHIVCDIFPSKASLAGIDLGLSQGALLVSSTLGASLGGIPLGITPGTITVDPYDIINLGGINLSVSEGALLAAQGVNIVGVALNLGLGDIAIVPTPQVDLSGIALAMAEGTISVVGGVEVTLAGESLSMSEGSITAVAPAADHFATFETDADGWAVYNGGVNYCGAPNTGRTSSISYAGSWSYTISGTDDGTCSSNFANACLYQTFTNVSSGNITFYAEGQNNTYGTPSVDVRINCNTSCTGGTSLGTTAVAQGGGWTLVSESYAGGSNVKICIVSDFATTAGAYIDNITVPGGG